MNSWGFVNKHILTSDILFDNSSTEKYMKLFHTTGVLKEFSKNAISSMKLNSKYSTRKECNLSRQ